MKEEIREALEEIGYHKALRLDRSLIFTLWEPTKRGRKLYQGKVEARESIDAYEALAKAFSDLTPRCWELLKNHARSSVDWEDGREPVSDVISALMDLRSLSKNELDSAWGGGGPGPSRQHGADATARVIAKIFVLGSGDMPGSGTLPDGQPSGRYATTVKRVLELSGFKDNFRAPCDRAVKWLKADNNLEFNRLANLRSTKGRRISLLTGKVSK